MEETKKSSTATYVIVGLIVLAVIIGLLLVNANKKTAEETSTETTTTATENSSGSASRAQAAYTSTRILENGRYVTIVTYTDKEVFEPQIVSINRGEEVRFVNKSNLSMRIASNAYGNIPIYPGLDQEKSVGTNGVYKFTFTESGVWGYHNLDTGGKISPIGIIYVK